MTIGVATAVRRSSGFNRVDTTIPKNTTLASAVFASLPAYTTATSRKSAILARKKVWKLVEAVSDVEEEDVSEASVLETPILAVRIQARARAFASVFGELC